MRRVKVQSTPAASEDVPRHPCDTTGYRLSIMINGGSLGRVFLAVTTGCAAAFIAALPVSADGTVTGSAGAAAVAGGVPTGGSVWIKPSGGTYQMLRLWRSGSKLRIYRDEGNYPGDGFYCSWGSLRGKTFVGREQRLPPEPVAVRYSIRKKGSKLKVAGIGSASEDRSPWRRASVQKYTQLVPDAAGNTGEWCRTFRPVG